MADTKTDLINSYDLRKAQFKKKWVSKEERDTVSTITTRFDEMKDARKQSCPFANPYETQSVDSDAVSDSTSQLDVGTDWSDFWDRSRKQWLRWKLYLEDEPNIKSSTAFAPIEAIQSEFLQGKTVSLFSPTEEEDDVKVQLIEKAEEHLSYKADLQRVDAETFHEASVLGTSIRYVGWFVDKRTVTITKSPDEVESDLDNEEDKDIREKIQKQLDDKKPVTKKEEIKKEEIGHARVTPYEFYIDSDARCMRGPIYEASDCIWRQTPSLEQFLSEFQESDDPWVKQKNVDNVVSAKDATEMYEDDRPFFVPPKDINSETQVELVRYYNKRTDKYVVVANDVVVRDGPLPYNHKELPFTVHRFIPIEDQFWGMGIPGMVEDYQSESEILRNLKLKHVEVTIAPPLLYNIDYAEDLDSWQRFLGGQRIGVSGPLDDSNIRWMPTSSAGWDYQQMQNDLQSETVQTTGINPIAYSTPKPGETARTNILSMESTLKVIKKYITAWAEGRKEAVWMDVRLMQQFYPLSYVEELDDNGDMKRKYKSIRTRGVKMFPSVYDGGVELSVQETPEKYGFFEMKDEYLNLKGDVDIELDLDSIVPTSQAMRMEKVEMAMAQLYPVLSNPEMLEAPGVVELVRDYVETHGLSKKILEQLRDESSEDDVEMAVAQEELMLEGTPVAGIPGESTAHKAQHLQTLLELLYEYRTPPEPPMPLEMGIDPVQQLMAQQQETQKLMEQAMKNEEIIKILSEHLDVDNTPKQFGTTAGLDKSAGGLMAGQPGSPGGAAGAPVMPEQLAQPEGSLLQNVPMTPTPNAAGPTTQPKGLPNLPVAL